MLDPVLLELAVLLVEEPYCVVGLLLHQVSNLGVWKGVRGNLLSGRRAKTHIIGIYMHICKIGSSVGSILKSPSQVHVQPLSSAEPAPCHPRCRESPKTISTI